MRSFKSFLSAWTLPAIWRRFVRSRRSYKILVVGLSVPTLLSALYACSRLPPFSKKIMGYELKADLRRMSDVHHIASIIESYYKKAGHYPLEKLDTPRLRDVIISPKKRWKRYEQGAPPNGGVFVPFVDFSAELRSVLGEELILPEVPERTIHLGDRIHYDFYQYRYDGNNYYVSGNLYYANKFTATLDRHHHKYMLGSRASHSWRVRLTSDALSEPLTPTAPPSRVQSRRKAKQLTRAVEKGDFPLVEKLMSKGVDPDFSPHVIQPPLWIAASKGDLPITRLLIEHGADVNPPYRPNMIVQPIVYPAEQGNLEMVKLLLDAGSDPNHWNAYFHTPLIYASIRRQHESVRMLLEHGGDPNQVNYRGISTFVGVCILEDQKLMEACLEFGADIETRYSDPEMDLLEITPLLHAVIDGRTEVARFLLERGADPSAKDGHGQSVSELAKRHDREEILKMLEEHALEVN